MLLKNLLMHYSSSFAEYFSGKITITEDILWYRENSKED